ncbi:MAG: hypothetical protein AAB546_02555 [Patescibacteria group bacterium]
MLKFLKEITVAAILSLLPTILIWLPFFLRTPQFWNIPLPQEGLATIVANYDGPLYLVVAKSLYNADIIKGFEFSLPVEYYAAHFPAYPLLIRLFSFVYLSIYSPLVVTMLSSILAIYFFRKLISQYLTDEQAIWATIFFSIFPARWLIVRSVGSPEPLFLAAIIASVYFFQNKKYWWAGIWGAVAAATKSPGILLFVAYMLALKLPELKRLATTNFGKWFASLEWRAYPILLIPLALLSVFGLYYFTYHDFFAYFHSGDNIHLFFPPFQIFNYSASWVGTFWLEEVIFVYVLSFWGLIKLMQDKQRTLAYFVAIFFATIIFVSHRDIIRYSLPIVPFLFVAFRDVFKQKEFKFLIMFIALPVYLFSLAYISQNVMPISNWLPFFQ